MEPGKTREDDSDSQIGIAYSGKGDGVGGGREVLRGQSNGGGTECIRRQSREGGSRAARPPDILGSPDMMSMRTYTSRHVRAFMAHARNTDTVCGHTASRKNVVLPGTAGLGSALLEFSHQAFELGSRLPQRGAATVEIMRNEAHGCGKSLWRPIRQEAVRVGVPYSSYQRTQRLYHSYLAHVYNSGQRQLMLANCKECDDCGGTKWRFRCSRRCDETPMPLRIADYDVDCLVDLEGEPEPEEPGDDGDVQLRDDSMGLPIEDDERCKLCNSIWCVELMYHVGAWRLLVSYSNLYPYSPMGHSERFKIHFSHVSVCTCVRKRSVFRCRWPVFCRRWARVP